MRDRAPGYYWVRTKYEDGEHWSVAEWRGPVQGWERNGRSETDEAFDAIQESRIPSPVERWSWDLNANFRIIEWAVASIEVAATLRQHGFVATEEKLESALRWVAADLTLAAEALGRAAAEDGPSARLRAERFLIGLLDSRDAVVREGACIGLSFLPETPAIETALAAHEDDIP